MYKLKVCLENTMSGHIDTHQCWANLIEYAYIKKLSEPENAANIISRELAKFNGVNTPGAYLEFETESDVIQFILTWG
jgi:hypothetical protein